MLIYKKYIKILNYWHLLYLWDMIICEQSYYYNQLNFKLNYIYNFFYEYILFNSLNIKLIYTQYRCTFLPILLFKRYHFMRFMFYYIYNTYRFNIYKIYLNKLNNFKLKRSQMKYGWHILLFNLHRLYMDTIGLGQSTRPRNILTTNLVTLFLYYYINCINISTRGRVVFYCYCFNSVASNLLITLRYITSLIVFRYKWLGEPALIFNICYLILMSLCSLTIRGLISIITFLFMRFRYRRQYLLFKFIAYILKFLINKFDNLLFIKGFYIQLRGKIGRGGSARRLKIKSCWRQWQLKNYTDKIMSGYQSILTVEGSLGLRVNIIYQ